MFSKLTTSIALIFVTQTARISAMDVCASTQFSCATTALFSCCTNLPNNVCCRGWPTNFGFGIDFVNPPAGQIWIGEGFADNACLNFETSGGSSAPQTCISVCSTCTAAKSAGWLLESVAARGEAVDEKDGLGFTSASECALPDVLRFVDASGVQREVKLPQDEEGFKRVHQLASAGNFEALLAL